MTCSLLFDFPDGSGLCSMCCHSTLITAIGSCRALWCEQFAAMAAVAGKNAPNINKLSNFGRVVSFPALLAVTAAKRLVPAPVVATVVFLAAPLALARPGITNGPGAVCTVVSGHRYRGPFTNMLSAAFTFPVPRFGLSGVPLTK